MLYVGGTLVKTKSIRQRAIAASTYGAGLGKTATEEVLCTRNLLRSLGMNLDGPTILLGDEKSLLISVTNPKSALNQRHYGISLHLYLECEVDSTT